MAKKSMTTNSRRHARKLQQGGGQGGAGGGQGGGGAGAERNFETSGLSVRILGQSGKFIASNANSRVQVTMDGLYERDENGAIVGNTGSVKHSINTFAVTDFTFTAEEIGQLLEVTDLDGNITEVSAEGLRVDFFTTLATGSKLLVQASLVSKAGLAGDNGGNWTVSPGDFKFNIELSDWQWCNPCGQNEFGAFVDLDIEIKTLGDESDGSGDGKPVLKRDGGNQTSFDLGDGAASLELSNAFMVRGISSSASESSSTTVTGNEVSFMPEGYPKVTTSNGKTLFTFRFAKFDQESSVKYDPIIKFSTSSDPNSGSNARASFGVVGVLGLLSSALTYYSIF